MGPYSEERQLRREKNLIRASLDPAIDDRMRNIYKSKINELARTENEYNLTVLRVYGGTICTNILVLSCLRRRDTSRLLYRSEHRLYESS